MGMSDRHIAEQDRCSTCRGSGWTWWPATEPPEEGKWIVCRICIGTGRTDHKGRKRQKPDEAPDS
jgi:DnaJ-class molecular chaperone